MNDRISVMLVDDHESVRVGVRAELLKHPELELVAEAENVQQAIERATALMPDILLLDIDLPGRVSEEDGIAVIAALRAAQAPTQILVYSGYRTEGYILSAVAEGVAGYLLKTEKLAVVAEAIKAVGGGEEGWFSREVMARIARSKRSGLELTRRELELLRHLHKSNEEMARDLGIALNTVKKHVGNVLAKLGVPSRAAALDKAWKAGLLS